MKPRHNQYHLARLSAIIIALVAIIISIRSSQAGPASSGPIGTAVYQGLVAVTSDTSASLLELGNNGQDIAASMSTATPPLTGNLYLRSNSVSDANALRISKSGSLTSLYVPGGLCFGTLPCADAWPTSGGTSYWQLSGGMLIPATATNRVVINKVASGVPPYEVLTVVGNNSSSEVATVRNAGRTAARFGDNVVVGGNISLPSRAAGDEALLIAHVCDSGQYQGLYCSTPTDCEDGYTFPTPSCVEKDGKIWHAGNDGHSNDANNPGPDASQLDGIPLQFLYNQDCGTGGYPTALSHYCLCTGLSCVALQ